MTTNCPEGILFPRMAQEQMQIVKRKRNPKFYSDFLDYVPKIIYKLREHGRNLTKKR